MSIKTVRKIGFFAALSMLIGSVVGIGIFFKNGSILKAGDNNGLTALMAWIVGGLFALFAALSFSEIGTLKVGKLVGLTAWSKHVGGRKYGFFVRTTFTIFYWGFLTPIIAYFVTELLFLMLHAFNPEIQVPKVWVNGLISISIAMFALTVNYLSVKVSGVIQQIATVLKFLPLLISMVVGILFLNTHHVLNPHDSGPKIHGKDYFLNGHFTFLGLLAGLPAVLFSYDAFMIVPQLTNKVKGGTKTVSKIVLFGLISIIILYSLIAVASIFHAGSITNIIIDSLDYAVASKLNIFVYITLFVAGYGVLNGVCAAMVAANEQAVAAETIFGLRALKRKFGQSKATIMTLAILFSTSFLLCVLPGMILGADAYIDAVSNFPTLFFFAIYATTVLLYTLKRKQYKTQKLNHKLFYFAAVAFVVGTYFVVAYQAFFGFTVRGFINGAFNTNVQGVGLFAKQETIITNLDFFLIFIVFLAIFMLLPVINYYLIKKYEKRDPFVLIGDHNEDQNASVSKSLIKIKNTEH